MTRVSFPWYLPALILGAFAATAPGQEPLGVEAVVSSDSVTLGEPFDFQLQVSGSEAPSPPDLTGLADFTVTPMGNGTNSSSSVTIINGQVTQNVRKGFLFNYQLVARKAGSLTIPPLTVKDGPNSATTRPLVIRVGAMQENDHYKLRVSLPGTSAWVGEALHLGLTFYYDANLEQPRLNLPVANDPSFQVHEADVPITNQNETLDGRTFQTMKLLRILVPRRAGSFHLEPATFIFRGVDGYEIRDDPFFGRQRVPRVRNFVVPSNALDLTVRELPADGKPANFAGHVGRFSLSTSANPLKVNVGDPLNLVVKVSAPTFLNDFELPPLQRQTALAKDFRLPAEPSPGQVGDDSITFTYTIRVAREGLREIPPLELPFFDPDAAAYRVARSEPIPIEVVETRVVTARDAEGTEPVTPRTAEVEAWSLGIAHNYEDPDALRSERFSPALWFRSAAFWTLLLLPAALHALLRFLVGRQRTLHADPGGARQARAARNFHLLIDSATSTDRVLEAFRTYLGDRLRLSAGALTANDLRAPLQRAGVPGETIAAAEDLFRRCEASRYSGGQAGEAGDLAAACRDVVAGIESGSRTPGGTLLRRLPIPGRFLPLLTALLAFCGISGAALSPADQERIFHEANALFRQANEQSATQPDAAGETYAKAILHFEQLIREGAIENGKLYYNLGNAYFRTRDPGRAILNYRRAADLRPHDPNLAQNLAFARSRRVDRIEATAKRRVAEILFFWHHDLPPALKATLFGWATVLAWAAATARLFRSTGWLLWTTLGSALVAGLMLLSLAIDARSAREIREGVLVAPEVVARKGDSDSYEPSFKEPLHAGTEIRIRETRAGWILAELGDGRTCWLPAKAVEAIW